MGFPPFHDFAIRVSDDQNFRVKRMRTPVQFAPEDAHTAGPAPRIRKSLDVRWIVCMSDVTQDWQDFRAWHPVGFLKIFEPHTPPRIIPHPMVFEQVVSELFGGFPITHGFPPSNAPATPSSAGSSVRSRQRLPSWKSVPSGNPQVSACRFDRG